MYNDTITIFNRKPGNRGEGDTWHPTVIHDVNLNIDRAAILAKYGAQCQDKAVVNIRYEMQGGQIIVASKRFQPTKEWSQTADTLTLTPVKDFVWAGEWDGGVVSDADYGTEGFYGHMNRTKDNVFLISSVARYSAIPHFEVVGK